MDFKIIRSNETITSSWSGGTTKELYIFPENSSFHKRDFLFRISQATVEVETSDFTALPGVERTLMVLEGSLKLMHENHHEILLEEFDQDSFKGEWNTKSTGIVSDFNLMLREGTMGTLKHRKLSNQEKICIELTADLNLFYVVNGSFNFNENELNSRDVLIIKSKGELCLSNSTCDLIHVNIQLI